MSSHVLASVHAVLVIILRVGRLRNGTGPELRHIRLPSLDFSPGLPGRPRRPRTPSKAVEVAQRSISSVSGAPAGAPACRCRWVAWISRVMQQRRSAQTGAARLQHARMCVWWARSDLLEGVPLTFGSQQVIVYRQAQQSAPSISGHLQPATEHTFD